VTNEICSDEASITIVVEKPLTYIIPNVITPNGDGSNDILNMNIINAQSVEIMIFNRWGNHLGTFNSLDLEKGWGGTYKNSGKPVSDGVYFYTYKITSIYGEVVEGHQYLHVKRGEE
jgi:gliding motility-associated-like protein